MQTGATSASSTASTTPEFDHDPCAGQRGFGSVEHMVKASSHCRCLASRNTRRVWCTLLALVVACSFAADFTDASMAGTPALSHLSTLSSLRARRGVIPLRGGAEAKLALTEEEEAAAMGASATAHKDTKEETGKKEGEEAGSVEMFAQHLQQVDANPSAFIPCPQPGCLRFLPTQDVGEGKELTCECQVSLCCSSVSSSSNAKTKQRARRDACSRSQLTLDVLPPLLGRT